MLVILISIHIVVLSISVFSSVKPEKMTDTRRQLVCIHRGATPGFSSMVTAEGFVKGTSKLEGERLITIGVCLSKPNSSLKHSTRVQNIRRGLAAFE
jgi:hypothetical protein